MSKKWKDKAFTDREKLSKLLEKEETKGTIHPISADNFLLIFMGLVTYPLLGKSLAMPSLHLSEKKYMEFLHKHKECVADSIIRMIKK